jgi:DeoC/LacD family aldolase
MWSKPTMPGDPESMRRVVEGCPVPILVLGGSRCSSDEQALDVIRGAIAGGAAGVLFDRNVFQAEDVTSFLEKARGRAQLPSGHAMRVSTQSAISAVRRVRDLLHGRAGYRIETDWGGVAVLEGGGHICEANLKACGELSPLWIPPWKTIDPQDYSPSRHARRYGPSPDGRLLAGIAGHSLSFDHFGPPSKEETAAGRSTHGEAPSVKWKLEPARHAYGPTLRGSALLPESQLRFTRSVTLDFRWPVIYCEEQARNLSAFDRPISWTEHVTFGPPFVEPGITIFDMPATRAKVCPPSYSSRPIIKPDAEFKWPLAPAIRGGVLDLRTIPDSRFGNYTAQLLDPPARIVFTSACNPRLGLLVVYAFRRTDFPWVGRWLESFYRPHAPWRRRTLCCGMEFSTTPFSIPRRESVEQNRLFGEKTYRWLPAKSTVAIRFITLLFKVPSDFRGVRNVSVTHHAATAVEMGARPRRLRSPVHAFM